MIYHNYMYMLINVNVVLFPYFKFAASTLIHKSFGSIIQPSDFNHKVEAAN